MHRNMNDASEDCKDPTRRVYALFELQILVPERMRKEVKSYAVRTALEESKLSVLALKGMVRCRRGLKQEWWVRTLSVLSFRAQMMKHDQSTAPPLM